MAGIVWWDGVSEAAANAIGPSQLFAGGEGPDYPDNPWDTVTLNGERLPGLCSVEGLPTLKIDQKKKGGSDSVSLTQTGYLPGPINITCVIWTLSHWTILQRLASSIWRKPNRKSKLSELAISIEHPALSLWGLAQVVVQGVSTLEIGPVVGTKVLKIRCLEYVPPARGDKTKTAKSTSFERSQRIPKLPSANEARKPSDTPPGPHG